MTSRTLSAGLPLLLSAALHSSAARAGNDDESFVGNQAAMAGGAVSAMVADASATFYNPSGLANVDHTHVDVSGTAYTVRSYQTPDLIRSTSGETANLSVREFVSIPSQLAYARALGPGVTLGLGYFVPQSSNLLLRKSLAVDIDASQSAWQLAISATRITHSFGAALGLKLTSRVRLGFGLIGTYEVQSFATSIITSKRDDGAQTAFALSSQIGNASRVGVEPTVGFQLELSPHFTLSATARGPRTLLYQSSQQSIAIGGGQSGSDIDTVLSEPDEAKGGLHLLRAGRAGVGLAYRPSRRAWISLEADAQPSIHSDKSEVQRRAVFNARLGGVYQTSDLLALGAGLFTDRSPDEKSSDAINGSGDFYGGTLGVEFGNRHRLHPQERADSLLLSTTVALKYAFSNGTFNGLVVSPQNIGEISTAERPLITHEASLYVGGGVSF